MDDKYFLSGSLDNKIRIWNIPEHRVVDWTDMREMVTACTYTADGSVSSSLESGGLLMRFYRVVESLVSTWDC